MVIHLPYIFLFLLPISGPPPKRLSPCYCKGVRNLSFSDRRPAKQSTLLLRLYAQAYVPCVVASRRQCGEAISRSDRYYFSNGVSATKE